VTSNLNKIRGQVGFCAQKDFLLMWNTVYDNLSFFAEIKKVPADQLEAEIERVMLKMGLTPYKDMPAINLSGGFKRKLNVAIALLGDPKVIVMDEPTSGIVLSYIIVL
jgi:ABC-type multidrug transport system ATPase subunit